MSILIYIRKHSEPDNKQPDIFIIQVVQDTIDMRLKSFIIPDDRIQCGLYSLAHYYASACIDCFSCIPHFLCFIAFPTGLNYGSLLSRLSWDFTEHFYLEYTVAVLYFMLRSVGGVIIHSTRTENSRKIKMSKKLQYFILLLKTIPRTRFTYAFLPVQYVQPIPFLHSTYLTATEQNFIEL